jgi:hypothetical protein
MPRERDRLGRPLPEGARGVPGPVSRPDRTPQETLAEAQRWLDQGNPFAAHEVLEDAWKASIGADRDLWQALAQLAVGLTHTLRGNAAGAEALLDRGAAKLAPYQGSPPHDVDVVGLLAWAATRPVRTPPRLTRS